MINDPVAWLYGLQSHGVKLGLDGIRALLALLDHPERAFPFGPRRRHERQGLRRGDARRDARASGSPHRALHLAAPRAAERADPDRGRGHRDARAAPRARTVARAACERGLAERLARRAPVVLRGHDGRPRSAPFSTRRSIPPCSRSASAAGSTRRTRSTRSSPRSSRSISTTSARWARRSKRSPSRRRASRRSGRTFVSGVVHPEAAAVIRERCEAIGAQIPRREIRSALPIGSLVSASTAAHQRDNARVAVRHVRRARSCVGRPAGAHAIRAGPRDGCAGTVACSSSRGRRRFCSTAHTTPRRRRCSARTWRLRTGPKPVLLFGAMADKDIPGILGPLAPHVASVVATQPTRASGGARADDVASRPVRSGLPAGAEADTGAAWRGRGRWPDPAGSCSSPARCISSGPFSPRSKGRGARAGVDVMAIDGPVLTMVGCRCAFVSAPPEARSRRRRRRDRLAARCSGEEGRVEVEVGIGKGRFLLAAPRRRPEVLALRHRVGERVPAHRREARRTRGSTTCGSSGWTRRSWSRARFPRRPCPPTTSSIRIRGRRSGTTSAASSSRDDVDHVWRGRSSPAAASRRHRSRRVLERDRALWSTPIRRSRGCRPSAGRSFRSTVDAAADEFRGEIRGRGAKPPPRVVAAPVTLRLM